MKQLNYEQMPIHLLSILAQDYPKPTREELIDFLITKEKQRSYMSFFTVGDIKFTRIFRIKNIVKKSRAEYFQEWNPGDTIELSFELMPAGVYTNGVVTNLISVRNKTINVQFSRTQRVLIKNLAYFEFEEID